MLDTYLAIAGIVLGVAAMFMAIPPLFQMLFGRPQLYFEAHEHTSQDGKELIIAIKNKPIKSKLLRRFGIEREIGNIVAYLDVQEQGTNKYIAKDVFGRLHCAPTRETDLVMARAFPGYTIGLSVIFCKEDTAAIVDVRTNELSVIPPGDYTACSTIVRGERTYRIQRRFKIGKTQHETFWV